MGWDTGFQKCDTPLVHLPWLKGVALEWDRFLMKVLDAIDLQACSVLTQAAGTLKMVRMMPQTVRLAAPCLHHHAVLQEGYMHMCIRI